MLHYNTIPQSPTQVHVEITPHCNLACGFCPVHRMKRGEPLTRDQVLDVLSQACDFNPEYIDFVNYNEPLTCRDFWTYAAVVTSRLGHGHLGLVTNGTVMTEEIAFRLISLGLRQVVFSIDAATPETYAKVRPRHTPDGPREDAGLRDTVYKNVDLYVECLRRAGSSAWPVVQMTVCDANAHEVDAFLAYWRGRPVSQALALNCTGRGGERPYTTPNATPCRAILDGLWVLSDGRVVACCEDWDALDPVGDVRRESLSRIWNGDAIQRFRTAHFAGRKRDVSVCAACQTSQDTGDHNAYPRNTRWEVLEELGRRGVGPMAAPVASAVKAESTAAVTSSGGGEGGSGAPAPPATLPSPTSEVTA